MSEQCTQPGFLCGDQPRAGCQPVGHRVERGRQRRELGRTRKVDPLEAVRVEGLDGPLQAPNRVGDCAVQAVAEPADEAKAQQRHRKQHIELDLVGAGRLRQVRGEHECHDEDLDDAGRHGKQQEAAAGQIHHEAQTSETRACHRLLEPIQDVLAMADRQPRMPRNRPNGGSVATRMATAPSKPLFTGRREPVSGEARRRQPTAGPRASVASGVLSSKMNLKKKPAIAAPTIGATQKSHS